MADTLRQTRRRTLGLIDAWAQAKSDLAVPCEPELNLPLWELGHVGWFQEWWIARNAQRARGDQCDPLHQRAPSRLASADSLYDSSAVAHARRWELQLPDLATTRQYLSEVLADTLAHLNEAAGDDRALYFWRLVLFHEQMHNEAMAYMAQSQGIALPRALVQHRPIAGASDPGRGTTDGAASDDDQIAVAAQRWTLGSPPQGFAFDNEIGHHSVELATYRIDVRPVPWSRYLSFVQQTGHRLPAYVRERRGQWERCDFGQWSPLDFDAPAVHISWHDAQAWCQWANRRLPSEAQWECAARTQPALQWGAVWEWTDSVFAPFPGFVAHPYRDYSAPWFDSRRVLRGACLATSAEMVNDRYRNFFPPDRRDIFAGFRSVGSD